MLKIKTITQKISAYKNSSFWLKSTKKLFFIVYYQKNCLYYIISTIALIPEVFNNFFMILLKEKIRYIVKYDFLKLLKRSGIMNFISKILKFCVSPTFAKFPIILFLAFSLFIPSSNAFWGGFKDFVRSFSLNTIQASDPETQVVLSDEKMQLTIWTYQDGEDVFRWTLSSFSNKYPNIDTEIRGFYSEEVMYAELQKAYGRGDMPDVFMLKDTWLENSFALISPSTKLSPEDLDLEFLPIAKEAFATETKVWVMPLYVESLAMFYNPLMLQDDRITLGDRPKELWQDFLESNNAFNEIDQSRSAFVSVRPSVSTKDLFLALLLQSEAEKEPKASKQAQDSISFLKLLNSSKLSTNLTDFDIFKTKKVAIIFGDENLYKELKKEDVEFSLQKIPQLHEENPITLGKIWGFTVSAKSEHVKESWALVEYLCNEKNSQDFSIQTQKTPARKDIGNGFFAENAKIAHSGRIWEDMDFNQTFIDNFKDFIKDKIDQDEFLEFIN